jgi:hypothetical protein
MHGAILADRCVTANLCDKIFLTSWYGARLSSKRREDTLQRELTRVQKSADRLMAAYQEDLLSLDDLRRRML